VRSEGAGPPRRLGHPSGVLAPHTGFLDTGHPAHVTVIVEDDGNLRFTHPAVRYGDEWYPSLAIEAARLYLGLDKNAIGLDLDRGVLLGNRLLESGTDLTLPINYAGPEGTYPAVSLIDVANGKVAPEVFEDRLVLIGAAATGLGDRFVTPYSPNLPGVETWANVIDNILYRGFLRRVPPETDVLVIIAGGLLALLCGALGRTSLALSAMAVLTLGWCVLNAAVFTAAQTWLNFIFPAASIVLGTIVVVAARSLRESRLRLQSDRDRQSMARYIPPLTGRGMTSDDGGQSHMAVVMFVDLVGYTKASEHMTPAETAALLRRFHGGVEQAVTNHGGVIDKFIGDAALAVFGLPDAGPAHAGAAIACARRIADELAEWDRELKAAGNPGIGCGAGLHFGPVVVAEVGGAAHAQVTVTGDTVNVASRLEALTRSWRTTIIASDAVVDAARSGTDRAMLDGFTALPFQEIRGRDRPVGIWCWPAPVEVAKDA
jgi:adenylate cyclase